MTTAGINRGPSGFFGFVCVAVSWLAASVFIGEAAVAVYCWPWHGSPQFVVPDGMPQTVEYFNAAGYCASALAAMSLAAVVWFVCRISIVLIQIKDRLGGVGGYAASSQESA